MSAAGLFTRSDRLTQVKHGEGGLAHGEDGVVSAVALRWYSIHVTAVGKIVPANASQTSILGALRVRDGRHAFCPGTYFLRWTHTQSEE